MADVERILAGPVDGWADGDALRIEGEPPVAVYRDGDAFYATADWCTHDRASLAEGWFDKGIVECPWHMAQFCVRTGKALSAPATVDLQIFEVLIEDGQVYVLRGRAQ